MPYKGIFDAMGKTIKSHGITGLWVGLPTYILRVSPHVMITFLVGENLKRLFL